MREWVANQFEVAPWKVRGLAQKEVIELVTLLRRHKIDFASKTETKILSGCKILRQLHYVIERCESADEEK